MRELKFGYEEVDSGSTASKCPTCEQAWSLYSSESDDSDPGRSSQTRSMQKWTNIASCSAGKYLKILIVYLTLLTENQINFTAFNF